MSSATDGLSAFELTQYVICLISIVTTSIVAAGLVLVILIVTI